MSFDLSYDNNPTLTQGVNVILTLAEIDHIDNALTRVVMDAESKMGDIQKMSRCLLYTSPSPRDKRQSRMPSSA